MAQVLQCDACGKIADKLAPVTVGGAKKECCAKCIERVVAVLNPKPRGPKPLEITEVVE